MAACSTSLSSTAPAGKDLSGVWVLNPAQSDPPPRFRDLEKRRFSGGERTHASGSERGERSQRGASQFIDPKRDFPNLMAREMVIEQDAASMGIAYRDAPYRDVTWGERHRHGFDIDAGWDADGDLVVRQRGEAVNYEEVWTLGADGDRLTLRIKVSGKRVHKLELERVYERKSAAAG